MLNDDSFYTRLVEIEEEIFDLELRKGCTDDDFEFTYLSREINRLQKEKILLENEYYGF